MFGILFSKWVITWLLLQFNEEENFKQFYRVFFSKNHKKKRNKRNMRKEYSKPK